MGRRLRTRLDLLMPTVKNKVEESQHAVISRTENRGSRQFNTGDQVQARNYGEGNRWKHGHITEVLGKRHYNVHVQGQIWKRHTDQLIKS